MSRVRGSGTPGWVRTGLATPGRRPGCAELRLLVVVDPGPQVVEAAQDLGVGAQEPDHQHGQQGHHDALEDDQDDHRLSLNSVAAGRDGTRDRPPRRGRRAAR